MIEPLRVRETIRHGNYHNVRTVDMADVFLSGADWHTAGIGVGLVRAANDGRRVGIFTLERIAS